MLQDADTSSQSPQQKVKKAVEQLWAYMTVNHLLYGVLTTHQETYFFRRHDPNTAPDHSTAQLEISLAISHDSEPPVTLMASWLYMLQAVNKQYFYSSPYNTPRMRRARKTPITYEQQGLSVSDVYFGERLLVHGAAGTAVDGHCGHHTNCVMKLVDGLNGPEGSVETLEREVQVFQRLQNLQGTVIPRFFRYGMLWDWLHLIAMENCGEPLHEAEIAGHAGRIRELVQALHDKGVLHGDIRRDNILKDGKGNVRLIDFSHSKFKEDEDVDWERECQQELAMIDTLNEID
jgi:serine/threonine protein kinase